MISEFILNYCIYQELYYFMKNTNVGKIKTKIDNNEVMNFKQFCEYINIIIN